MQRRDAFWRGLVLVSLLLGGLLLPTGRTGAQVPPPGEDDSRDLFGMVARDPHYEFDTNPAFPNASNRTALERQAAEMREMGVRWVRMEFWAHGDTFQWERYDPFIKEIAPRYGLKILALLNAGMVNYDDQMVNPAATNDPPDQADGTNHYIRVFRWRAQQLAQHYGDAIGAYEVVNEPNINWELWNATGLRTAEINPERYAMLLTHTYRYIKAAAPHAQVIIGGMLLGPPPNDETHDELDWLYQLYVAPAVRAYQASGDPARPGWNGVPWDGVGLHPYYVGPEKFQQLIRVLVQKLRDRGDARSRIWVTEIGKTAAPNPPDQPPSAEEEGQAALLTGVYRSVLDDPALRAAVHTIFWFKYEDFPAPHPSVPYGVVRLAETDTGYAPGGAPAIRKLAYRAYQALARPGGLPETRVDLPLVGDPYYFPATGQQIAPEFQHYWARNGGLAQFGYPLTQPTLVRGFRTQFFERAVFEYHPENTPPFDVLLRRLGAEILTHAYPESEPFASTADRLYFPETHHSLGGRFLQYWQMTGGLPVYGYPLSEEVEEVNLRDNRIYTVQYFERNRIEYHPEHAGTPFEMQLGLLGGDLLLRGLWWR